MQHLVKLFAILVGFSIFIGCSQNVNKVTITPRNPYVPYFFHITDSEHQGGTAQGSFSTSAILGAETLGGNLSRTNSSSPSFKMVSGIGVD